MNKDPNMDSISSLTSDQKLDLIIGEVSKIALLVTKVTALEEKVKAQDHSISALQKEVLYLKNKDNDRDQLERSNSLRIFNFPGSGSETGLANKVYELLKPLLTAAKTAGQIPTLPQAPNALEDVFRAGKFAAGAGKPPPPIIVKFPNDALRMAVLKNKKRYLPPPEEGAKKIVITEDLTRPTHRKFKELLEDERTDKIWTFSGGIWVVPKATKVAVKVKSVYDSNDAIFS